MKLSTAILCGLFFGFVGVFFFVAGVRSAVRGEYLSAFAAAGFVVFCFGIVIPIPRAFRRDVSPCVEVGTGGTVIGPDRRIDVPLIVTVIGGTAGSALVAVLLPIGRLDLPVPATGRYSIPFGAALFALMGIPFVVQFLRRGSTKYLRLTPTGFAIAEGLRAPTGTWNDVVDVTNAVPGKEPVTVGSIVFVMSDGDAHNFAAGGCTPAGTALRDLVRYYWQHPDDRDELTDGRAAQRLTNLLASDVD